MPEQPTETQADAEAQPDGETAAAEKPAQKLVKKVPAKTGAAKEGAAKKGTAKKAAPQKAPAPEPDDAGPVFSAFGIASAALAVVCVAAVVLVSMMWLGHRDQEAELSYRTRVLQAAAEWTSTLINLNIENAEASLQTLRDGTVGELNAEFDATIESFVEVLERVEASTQGQVESAAIETLRHDPDAAPGSPPVPPQQQPELAALAARTDTVLVVATSISENVASGEPKTIRWNLRLDVSDVEGRLLISRLERVQ